MKSICQHLFKVLEAANDPPEIRVVKLPSPEIPSPALEALHSGKVLILVFERLELTAVGRVVNSLSSSTAVNGQIEWLGEQTFLFAPRSCQISSTKPDPQRSSRLTHLETCQSDLMHKVNEPDKNAIALLNALELPTVERQLTEILPIGSKASWADKLELAGSRCASQRQALGSQQRTTGDKIHKILLRSPSRRSAETNLSAFRTSVLRPSRSSVRLTPIRTWLEELENHVLEMVVLPEGTLTMGSPETEPERSRDESPQHLVKIASVSISKYPVTQSQWQSVAAEPQIERPLDPDPSYFKGANLPVEQVTWYDAIEFCARLAQKTGRKYRLPSEAEWEYACRAGTTTPFYFGATLSTQLANYDGRSTYGAGACGEYRQQTTPVGDVGAVNAFGLSDLHGNVWEWCGDRWHDNYHHAPSDGRAWLSGQEQQSRVIRGGSWYDLPRFCRSACRYGLQPGDRSNDVGFRVAYSE